MANSEINLCYFRVSKKGEKEQDLDHQITAVLNRFDIKNPIILKEKGSAYKLDNIKNRSEFLKLLDICFDADNMTIKDLYLQKYKKKTINIYLWDLNRIMRNLKFNMLFSILSSIHDVRIFSFSDREINGNSQESDTEFITLLLAMLSAKKAQDYSDDISKNIKKSFTKVQGISFSREGRKLGRKFKNLDGEYIDLTKDEVLNLKLRLEKIILKFNSIGYKSYTSKVRNKIITEFNIDLSSRYINKIKKRLLNGN